MDDKETLLIDLGEPDYIYCEECGQKIDIIEYLARNDKYKNNLCFDCTLKKIKKKQK